MVLLCILSGGLLILSVQLSNDGNLYKIIFFSIMFLGDNMKARRFAEKNALCFGKLKKLSIVLV